MEGAIDGRTSREDLIHDKQMELLELQIKNARLKHRREMGNLAKREAREREIHSKRLLAIQKLTGVYLYFGIVCRQLDISIYRVTLLIINRFTIQTIELSP